MRSAQLTTSASLSVVVPVYNSAGSLIELITRLEPVLSALTREFEIILVNDGSQDQSWQQIQNICAEHSQVQGIDLMRNYGQHNALLVGVREAHYEVVVTLDDDLQHPPEEIPKLLEKLSEGHDVVYGTPHNEQHGLWRDLASQLTKLALQRALGASTVRDVSAFRAFRTYLRDAFVNFQSPFVSIDVLLTWGTTQFAAISVNHTPRALGSSNYTFRKLINHSLNMLTGFSTLPLEIASAIGAIVTLVGLGVLFVAIASSLMTRNSLSGFLMLVAIMTLLDGIQLFTLGFIGVYLSRMHFRIMQRPIYVIRRKTDSV